MKLGPIYVITDTTMRPGSSHLSLVRAALSGGADTVQLRDKPAAHREPGPIERSPAAGSLSTRAFLAAVREAAALCRRAGVPLIVNDRTDVAWAADADGVHLGDGDLPLGLARALLGPRRILGASADTLEDVLARAAEGADYCGIGPVFPTSTKSDAGPVLGLDGLARIVAASPIPLVAIGGISLERLPDVAATRVHAAALVSAICAAEDPEAATRLAKEAWRRGGGRSS